MKKRKRNNKPRIVDKLKCSTHPKDTKIQDNEISTIHHTKKQKNTKNEWREGGREKEEFMNM